MRLLFVLFFFFQAEDGIRDLVRSRGLGDVYKRQGVIAVARRVGVVGARAALDHVLAILDDVIEMLLLSLIHI